MKCPACGYEQPQSEECQKCGIIIEKFFKMQDERKKKKEEEEEGERELEREEKEMELADRKEIFRSVSKKKIPVSILTLRNRIDGNLYVTKNFRMTDMLNSSEVIFVAVTEAKIYSLETGEMTEETDFVSINKNHITLVTEGVF